jgi:hypothetical protein
LQRSIEDLSAVTTVNSTETPYGFRQSRRKSDFNRWNSMKKALPQMVLQPVHLMIAGYGYLCPDRR